MKKIIIPAIIAKTQEEFEERINKVKEHAEVLQLDIMDGKFVDNNSIDFDFKLPENKCRIEAHLMIENPEQWVEKSLDKVDKVLFHFEACKDCGNLIENIKKNGKKVGIVINPETSVSDIKSLLDKIDQVLVMTVNPGFYGSKFLPETLNKVKELRKIKPEMDIEVDGGITADTIQKADEAGANLFVSGSYIQNSDNIKETIEGLYGLIKGD